MATFGNISNPLYLECSSRLPTQKELMQAYIDGSSYNLTSTAAAHWSLTHNSVTGAWQVYLGNGVTETAAKTGARLVRCVR
ncbi:hypothetical protein IPM44_03710 [bacterium]|nr:MAG: hypothetical protein IPM44_03710 [bacterium]